jgi:outer membrane protein, multidrug efflux system
VMERISKSVSGASLLLIFAGCVTQVPFEAPEVAVPEVYRYAPDEGVQLRLSLPRDASWWLIFNQPELDELMQRIALESPGYVVALTRIQEARLQAEAVRARRQPYLGYDISAERNTFSGAGSGFNSGRTRDTYSVPLVFQYELDAWGRIRKGIEAGEADAAASESDAAAILLLYQTELAARFLDAQALHTEREVLEQGEVIRQKALELMQIRFKAGDVSEIDIALAETELAEVRAERIGLTRSKIEVENAISALVGDLPTQLQLTEQALPPEPPEWEIGSPSELLHRRPDVQAAERRVEAEYARLGLARNLTRPEIMFTGSAGFEASKVGDLGPGDSETWNAGVRITGPLFDGRTSAIARELADVRLERAEAQYREVVVEAFRQCETTLGTLQVLDQQRQAYEATVRAARRTVSLTEKQYAAGFVDYFEVVTAQRTLLRNQQAAARLLGEHYQALIHLIKALGGA